MSETMNFWHDYSRIIMVIISPVIPATSLAQKFFWIATIPDSLVDHWKSIRT